MLLAEVCSVLNKHTSGIRQGKGAEWLQGLDARAGQEELAYGPEQDPAQLKCGMCHTRAGAATWSSIGVSKADM